MDICFNLLFTHPCQWEAAVIFACYILHAVNLFLIKQFDFLRFRNFCAAIKLHSWFWPLLIAFINFFPIGWFFFALFLFRCVLVIFQPSCKHFKVDNTGFIAGCDFHFYYHNLNPLYLKFFFFTMNIRLSNFWLSLSVWFNVREEFAFILIEVMDAQKAQHL